MLTQANSRTILFSAIGLAAVLFAGFAGYQFDGELSCIGFAIMMSASMILLFRSINGKTSGIKGRLFSSLVSLAVVSYICAPQYFSPYYRKIVEVRHEMELISHEIKKIVQDNPKYRDLDYELGNRKVVGVRFSGRIQKRDAIYLQKELMKRFPKMTPARFSWSGVTILDGEGANEYQLRGHF